MELQRMIARFVAEPAPFTQQALYLARRSILDTMGAMIAGSETAAVRQALTVTEGAGPQRKIMRPGCRLCQRNLRP